MKKVAAKKVERDEVIPPVRVTTTDRKHIQEKADRYAGGNVSAWVRHASRVYTPKRGERVRR